MHLVTRLVFPVPACRSAFAPGCLAHALRKNPLSTRRKAQPTDWVQHRFREIVESIRKAVHWSQLARKPERPLQMRDHPRVKRMP